MENKKAIRSKIRWMLRFANKEQSNELHKLYEYYSKI